MDKDGVPEVVRFLADCLRERGIHVAKVIVFGSRARGNTDPESDIDLAVISEDFRGRDVFERAELIGDAEWRTIERFVVPLDIILMTPEELDDEESLRAGYVKTGKVVALS